MARGLFTRWRRGVLRIGRLASARSQRFRRVAPGWSRAVGRKSGAPSSRRQCKIDVPQITIGGRFRARSEQHRQRAEIHIVGDDDVGREILQDLLQAPCWAGMGSTRKRSAATRSCSGPGGISLISGTTVRMSRVSKSAPAGSGWNFTPAASTRSRSQLPVRPTTS